MSLTRDHLHRLARVAYARDLGFVDLVGLAELDPAIAFRGAVLRGNMHGQDLRGFDFTGAEFRGCDLTGADLSLTQGITLKMLRTAKWDETTRLPPDIAINLDDDYLTGRYFVFRDELGLSEQEKHLIESSVLDFLPEPLTIFGASAGEFSNLAAEKMRRSDGSPFVLVRKATPREWLEHMTDEADRPSYEEPQDVDILLQADAKEALDFLVEIEPDPSDCETMKEYHDLMQLHEVSISAAKKTLRKFAEDIKPKTLEHMRKIYYELLDFYAEDNFAVGVASSYLNEAMHGIGGWQK